MTLLRLGDLQARVESSTAGRVLISLLAAVVVVSVALWNLPAGPGAEGSALRRVSLAPVKPLVYALGLDQDWGVFAPPRLTSIAVRARIAYSDGTTSEWAPPVHTGDLVGAYRDYRWVKFVEHVFPDDGRPLWRPFALWIARRHDGGVGERRPVAVSLIRRFSALRPVIRPGSPQRPGAPGSGTGPLRQVTYYTMRLAPRDLD